MRSKKLGWWLVVLGIIFLDQLSKNLLLHFFPHWLSFNRGVSFGLFPSNYWLIFNLGFIMMVIIFERRNFFSSLIIGGGISNLLDRLVRGEIIDFIDLNLGLPVFNLADFFICLGVILVLFGVSKG